MEPMDEVIDFDKLLLESGEEETDLDKIFRQLLDPNNIAHNSDLSANEVLAFSTLAAIAEKYDMDFLTKFIQKNMVMRVSKGRGGRKEWVQMITKLDSQKKDDNRFGDWRRWLK